MKYLLVCIGFFFQISYGQEMFIFKDIRDGKIYKTIKISNQHWFAENLIYRPKSGIAKAFNNDNRNIELYGYLYDYHTAMKMCPNGWHLPSDEEWKQLELYLGMNVDEFENNRKRAPNLGEQLKSVSGWYQNGNGKNTIGFNALPGGACLFYDKSFHFLQEKAYFWSSTSNGIDAWARVLNYDDSYFQRSLFSKNNYLSVRCVKNSK